MKISTILATKGDKIVTARANQTLKEAAGLLVQHRIGALIVVDEAGALVGILSERDLVREAAEHEGIWGRTVGEVMTQTVLTGSPQEDVRSVLQTMTNGRFRHLPILDRGKLVGVISIGDVVKAQLDEYAGEIDTLQDSV
jgi:CBS domain-containing protein